MTRAAAANWNHGFAAPASTCATTSAAAPMPMPASARDCPLSFLAWTAATMMYSPPRPAMTRCAMCSHCSPKFGSQSLVHSGHEGAHRARPAPHDVRARQQDDHRHRRHREHRVEVRVPLPAPVARRRRTRDQQRHDEHREKRLGGEQVGCHDWRRQLRQYRDAAQDHLHRQRNDRHGHQPLQSRRLPVLPPHQHGARHHQRADDACHQPVGVLDEDVVLEGGNDLPVAQRPVRAAQSRLRRPDEAPQRDEAERYRYGDGEQDAQAAVG